MIVPSPKNAGIARKTYCTSDPLSPGGPAGPCRQKRHSNQNTLNSHSPLAVEGESCIQALFSALCCVLHSWVWACVRCLCPWTIHAQPHSWLGLQTQNHSTHTSLGLRQDKSPRFWRTLYSATSYTRENIPQNFCALWFRSKQGSSGLVHVVCLGMQLKNVQLSRASHWKVPISIGTPQK